MCSAPAARLSREDMLKKGNIDVKMEYLTLGHKQELASARSFYVQCNHFIMMKIFGDWIAI
jgi:hypothetical protein